MSVFSRDFCKREFTEKYKLTRHVKSQHGLASVAVNRLIDVIIMKCINKFVSLKLLGSGVVDILIQLQRDSKIIQVVLVGALNGTVNEYRLNLEDVQQDASNVIKESTFQVDNRTNEEVVRREL